MGFLLLLISLLFSFIFFVFYKLSLGERFFGGYQTIEYSFSSLSGNIIYEVFFFLILGFILFIYFSPFNFFKKKLDNGTNDGFMEDEIEEGRYLDKIPKLNILSFLKKYLYYIGFILFYLALYLILYSFGIQDFSYIIFIFNITILVAFFITNKAPVFRDFVKINTILFSLYYTILYLYQFAVGIGDLGSIDFINTLFIFSFFIISFYADSKILKREGSDSPMVLYFFLYSFVVLNYYFKGFFDDFVQTFIYIGFFLNIFIYFFLQKVQFFHNSRHLLRALSFLFLYVSLLCGMYFLIKNFNQEGLLLNNLVILCILAYGIFFNYFIHYKYQNYISLFFSLLSIIFVSYYWLFSFISYENVAKFFIVVSLTLAFCSVAVTYLYNQKYLFDYVFLHLFGYIINIGAIIYYFYISDFTLLNFGIILLLNSIFVFMSYFKLKQLKD